ncbi:MAG: methylenetetrahydrofolate--tRNA-(uracil(54)-C(5))-methyltransferase (FADH(2)-oxidizing) TrmFO [Clostridia bacterium]|nr:methylenetetrahydrofolate--tRNA-(uracil(54)-C(5))-methyltransferase (FADH(2)-oxidizing) TrmFO [Clostridia bacterium]
MTERIKVVGAGLAGCEAAYQLAKRGVPVDLVEMRPKKSTPAHKTGKFAELVCSNSLKSEDVNTAQGQLKREMRRLDSLILRAADYARVPAGSALAVDRDLFSDYVERTLRSYKNIAFIEEEADRIEPFTIVATGPLTGEAMCEAIKEKTNGEFLNFFDAVAPIVEADSVDYDLAFFAGRYGKGGEDYLNCPMDKEQYYSFVRELVSAERVLLHDFEKRDVFNACMPVEVMADRGEDALRFGPLRPVGLIDPRTDRRPYAVVQLRKENVEGTMYNLVGFQTNLKFGEQKRVFSMIPALHDAEFVRYGVMHRNTFIDAPKVLGEGFSLQSDPTVFIAGQLSGVEGYVESAASGLLAGINAYRRLRGLPVFDPPATTMLGGLVKYVRTENKDFQPMHAGYPLTPELSEKIRDKQRRKQAYSERAERDFAPFAEEYEKQ